jgi:hypothetical protein
VTRGFMGPLGGFWPKLGRKRVTGWKQRSCVPPGRVKTNKQILIMQYFLNSILFIFIDTLDNLKAKLQKFVIILFWLKRNILTRTFSVTSV